MPLSTADKIARFHALHRASGAFVIPNPWDAGSARILAGLGFPALATSSAASAGTLGRHDLRVMRAEAVGMAKRIVEAVELPVSADFENGFGETDGDVVDTFEQAVEIGLAGASIEDAGRERKVYDLGRAADRVALAVRTAHSLASGFLVMARAENYLCGNPSLDDTITRLQAYEQAGADVLAAPGLPDLDSVRAVCAAVTKPVNFMNGAKGRSFSVAELSAAGVKRVSVATAFYRAAMSALVEVGREVHDQGTFDFADRILASGDLAGYFDGGTR